MEQKPINEKLEINVTYIKTLLGADESYDVIHREYMVGRKRAASFSIKGMTDDILMHKILENMIVYCQDKLNIDIFKKLFDTRAIHTQIDIVEDMKEALTGLLSGKLLFLIDGEERLLVIEARAYPVREIVDSSTDETTRGSRDIFVETRATNIALIRRRLRDPNLRFENIQVGARSRTGVAIGFIKDIANPNLVEMIRKRIENIEIDAIPMAEKAIEEYLVGRSNLHIFPVVRYTEKPDIAAVHLLEGHVCIIVDTSPNVMILPVTFWHHLQHAEEYRQNVVVGTFMKFVRYIGMVLSLLLPPLWVALVSQPNLLPDTFLFLGPQQAGVLPLGIQFILAELSVDLIKMAMIHVPAAQSVALGIVGALTLGEISVEVGLFNHEVVLYTAIAAVGTFAMPSVEFAAAIRILRLILLLVVLFFKMPGFLVGIVMILFYLSTVHSFGVPYLWPLIPFDLEGMNYILLRLSLKDKVLRPAALKPLDKFRTKRKSKDN